MASTSLHALLFCLLFIISSCDGDLQLGVNYGTIADNLPPPTQVAKLLQSTLITKVKLFSVDANILQAFAHTGIQVMLGIGNDQIKPLSNPSTALSWVQTNVVPYTPATSITSLAVGNEVLSVPDGEMIYDLHIAMENLHSALQQVNLPNILVTTPHSMGLLQSSVPPSNGSFAPGPAAILGPILSFLSRTSSPFLVNAYPFFGFLGNPNSTQLEYALFNASSHPVYDPRTKVYYTNMFVAQIDAVYSAIAALGFTNVSVAVGETGWPSVGDPYEPGVSLQNAQTFNSKLVELLKSGKGTPARPNITIETYIFALFNEDLKPGAASERNYGLFQPNMTPVYECGIMKAANQKSGLNPPQAVTSPSPKAGKKWCVAKSGASTAELQANIDWACQQKGTDCSAIQPNQHCYNPNDVQSHASYAMNSYYQSQGQHDWDCSFKDSGVIVFTDPSYGSCAYFSASP